MNIHLPPEQKLPDGFFDDPIPVLQVLYEAEQPVVFVTRTRQGQTMLAFVAAEDAFRQFMFLAPASQSVLDRLQSGALGVREALTESALWLLERNVSVGSTTLWSVSDADIPEGYLPRPGTPLLPEHRIAFSARAMGDGIALGQVPCSVIAYVADAARSALKSVMDHVMSARGEGRPTDAQRALYDLPVRQMRFASFEIGLSAPTAGDFFLSESVSQALKNLETGLAWATSEEVSEDLLAHDSQESVLRATLALTPPSTGMITAIEVGGSWLGGRKYHLSRESRSKVSQKLRKLQSEKIVVYTGRIGEIDDDKLSFTLRDVRELTDGECKGIFPDELLDDMRLHYFEANFVEISGVVRNGKLRVTAVVDTTPTPPEQATP